jgi:hypothetical protein
MPKGRDLAADLDRLVAASSMFAVQEYERATSGDEQDYDDAQQESHDVVGQVLDTIEKNLDEDLLESLDRGEYPQLASSFGSWTRSRGRRLMWPTWNYNNVYSAWAPMRRFARVRRSDNMLDEILDDFRADFEDRLRKARREDRGVTDAEVDEALQGLKEDLTVVARRSRRREERDEDNSNTRRGRTQRESRTA